MAEAAFSEDGKYYSAITQDGRLRIWDTETNVLKQEYTPDLHLTSPPSCLQWISITQSAVSQQKTSKRKSSTSEETHCIALGTTSGKILIYSVSQAKIETVLSDESNSNITTLDWHRNYGLYSCNKENYVYEWDLNNSSVRNKYNVSYDKRKQGNVSAIKIVPHKQSTSARYLVVASYQVRVWRLLAGDATVVLTLGHNAAPAALLNIATLNDVCWLIEGSQNERLISFFDVTITEEHLPQLNGDDSTPTPTPTKRQRKKSLTKAPTATPTYNFVLEDAPRMIDVDMRVEDGATRLSLAAATRSGVVHYYGHMLNGSSTKPIKPSVTIQLSTAAARPLPLQCCRLPQHCRGELLLGYCDGPLLLFERVVPDLKSKTQIIIRGEAKEAKKKVKQKNEVNKARSEGAAAAAPVSYAEPLGGVARKRPAPGAAPTGEVPMEARLANLSLGLAARDAPLAHNMTRLLAQGLHSRDQGIIRLVLQTNDEGAALRTVGGLPAELVPPLLEQLAAMATRKTSQCACVCTWVSALLRCHAALLLATLNSRTADHLTQLLAIFTFRRSHLCQLLNLKGRLQLTVAQRGAGALALQDQEPILDYNDTSSDEEMEAEQYHSDSAQSWGDDKFESGDQASGDEASAASDDDSDGGE